MSPTKSLLAKFVFLFLSGVIAIYLYLILNHPYHISDFISFYTSAEILTKEPENLYNFDIQRQYQHQYVPPNAELPTPDYLIPFSNPPHFLLTYQIGRAHV